MNKTFNKIIATLTLTILILITILFGIMTINMIILKNKVQDLENQISVDVKENSVENVIYRVSKTDDYYIAFTDNETVDYIYADNTDVYEGSMKRSVQFYI